MEDREVLIMKYLEGALSDEELLRFELSMESNQELRDSVNDLKLLTNYSAKRDQINESLSVLNEIHDEKVTVIPSRRRNSLFKKLLIGFVIISLGFLTYYILNESKDSRPQTNEQLYAYYFQPDDANFQTKGEIGKDELLKFQTLFNNKEYQEAILSIDIQKNNSADLQFYYAIALIASDKDQEGTQMLEELKQDTPIFRNESLYYQSLSFIKRGELLKAKTTLEQIELSSSKYQKASEILKSLSD